MSDHPEMVPDPEKKPLEWYLVKGEDMMFVVANPNQERMALWTRKGLSVDRVHVIKKVDFDAFFESLECTPFYKHEVYEHELEKMVQRNEGKF